MDNASSNSADLKDKEIPELLKNLLSFSTNIDRSKLYILYCYRLGWSLKKIWRTTSFEYTEAEIESINKQYHDLLLM